MHASGPEVYKLNRGAAERLHRIWYIERRTPDIKKRLEPKFDVNAAKVNPKQEYGRPSWDELERATEAAVPPVGQAGQPVRSPKDLDVVLELCAMRLLQWAVVLTPDARLFESSPLIVPIDPAQPFTAYNSRVDVDMSKVKPGARRPAGTAGQPAARQRTVPRAATSGSPTCRCGAASSSRPVAAVPTISVRNRPRNHKPRQIACALTKFQK